MHRQQRKDLQRKCGVQIFFDAIQSAFVEPCLEYKKDASGKVPSVVCAWFTEKVKSIDGIHINIACTAENCALGFAASRSAKCCRRVTQK